MNKAKYKKDLFPSPCLASVAVLREKYCLSFAYLAVVSESQFSFCLQGSESMIHTAL